MKIAIATNSHESTITTYIEELLKYLVEKNNHTLSDCLDADLIGLSISHVDQLGELISLRKKYPDKKIIVGGHIFHCFLPLLRYADFVNLGHGFQFFEEVKKIDDIYGLDYVVHQGKKEGRRSDYIDWTKNPVVQIGKNSYSYLWSVGCQRKCRFCLTSWINKHQTNPNTLAARSIRKKIGQGKQLYLISNESTGAYEKRSVADVLVKEAVKHPYLYRGIGLWRCGVEFVREENRKKFGKPITNGELKSLFEIASCMRKRMNIFLIAGVEEEADYLRFGEEVIPESRVTKPKLCFIVNYLSPQPMTPIENFNLERIMEINFENVRYAWKLRNGRVVIYYSHRMRPFNAIKNTICERSDEDSIERAWSLKRRKHTTMKELWRDIKNEGLYNLAIGKHQKMRMVKNA